MSEFIIQHINTLRQAMEKEGIDLYIQPSSDPHLSEYVADRFKGREFLTGFTGSAGTALITKDQGVLFTDGRYFIQAESQLSGTGIQLMKMDMEGYPTLEEWVVSVAPKGSVIGFDGRLFSHAYTKKLISTFEPMAYTYVADLDLLEATWMNRPAFPKTPVFHHPIAYTGKSISDKIEATREAMQKLHATSYILSSLNDIAWLFNIRANDVAYTPVAYAYALITLTEAKLYIDQSQVDESLYQLMKDNNVQLRPYDKYYNELSQISGQDILYDPTKVNGLMTMCITEKNQGIEVPDPVYMMKACISDVERRNLENAQIKDGVAMVRFLHWFDQAISSGTLTEYMAEEQVHKFRQMQTHFIEPSFKTIPAYGPNGAMMHYSTSIEASPSIEHHGLFLLDSGGQYLDGTTDITRTMACGPLTDEEKRDFTLVLKAHIRLNRLEFLQGVTGTNIDIIARQVMWENHMDYKSGTGHSVGYLLGVHEGPARIKKDHSDVVLKPGMVLTNEPGVYKEGKYGIRIENTLVVKEVASNDTGVYLGFDVISYCPIDQRCIQKDLLDERELGWLNDYHRKVREILLPHLAGEEKDWLLAATEQL